MKKLLLIVLLLSLSFNVNLKAQGSGTPSTLRVKTDANGYLLAVAATQTNPVTQGTFNTRILKTDASGSLLVVLTGSVTPTYPLAIPASTCAAPSLGLSGNTDNGIAFTATPSILNCIEGTAVTTLTGSLFTSTVRFLLLDGTETLPAYGFANWAGTGSYISDAFGNPQVTFSIATVNKFNITSAGANVFGLLGADSAIFNLADTISNLVDGSTGGFRAGSVADVNWYRGAADLWNTTDSIGILRGTITTDLPVRTDTVTWNNAGVTFTGWKLNVTNVASDNASLLMDLQTGGISKFSVNRSGTATATDLAAINTVTTSASGFFGWSSRAFITSPADGVLTISNNALSSITRVILGTNNTSVNGFSFEKDSGGHFNFARGDGSTGTLAVANIGANSCGTSAATIVGTDHVMRITVGATAGTACRVTFVSTWAIKPVCAANNNTTVANVVNAGNIQTTTVDVTGTFVAGDEISILCDTY